VPICCELRTGSGWVDILLCTPRGRLCVIEVKLWRNPEARRKVVGQILEYATELSRWSYEDLQRQVSRATGRPGNALHELVAEAHPEVEEASFVDAVSRSLRAGDFLLLVVGDGIREGVERIADYLEGSHSLAFTFGLIELALFRLREDEVLVQPRVLARTAILQRTVIRLDDGSLEVRSEPEEEEESRPGRRSDSEDFYRSFWGEFQDELVLDDVDQPLANVHGSGAIYYAMPPGMGQAWITVFFYMRNGTVGLYFTLRRGDFADLVYERLKTMREEIDRELEVEVSWNSEDGKHWIECSRQYDDPHAPEHREGIKAFLALNLNRFVNALRPRMARIVEELQ